MSHSPQLPSEAPVQEPPDDVGSHRLRPTADAQTRPVNGASQTVSSWSSTWDDDQTDEVQHGSGWPEPVFRRIRGWGLPPPPGGTDAKWYHDSDGSDSDRELPPDDEFPDPQEDRAYLEFVLHQRDCATRRRNAGLQPRTCTRLDPCDDCAEHDGAYFPSTFWQTISGASLQAHVAEYLARRPSLPVWRSTLLPNLHAPRLIFGPPQHSAATPVVADRSSPAQEEGTSRPVFGPERPVTESDIELSD